MPGTIPQPYDPTQQQHSPLAFARDIHDLRTPNDVIAALHDTTHRLPAFEAYNVMGCWHISDVISHPNQREGKTLFWHASVPKGYADSYFTQLDSYGPSVTQQLVRRRPIPFTMSEAMQLAQVAGADRWVFDNMHKHGMRDGLVCPFVGWVLTYWTAQPINPSWAERRWLGGAAYFAVERISELVPDPEAVLRNGKTLTARQIQALRGVAEGLSYAELGARLGGISTRAVEDIINRAKKRLGAKTTAQLVAMALRMRFFY